VALHPTARLIPPLYIGENSRIGRGAQIGPFAVIGQNCIINEHTILINSMVAAGTYVGEGLELDSAIVYRNRLLNVRLQTSILASEAFLLGSLTERAPNRGLYRVGSALMALLILFFLWPVLLLTALALSVSRRGSFIWDETVHLPADADPANWRSARLLRFRIDSPQGKVGEFLYTFVPGLISVLKGDVFLVGVRPRTRPQVLALPFDWRTLYLKTKAGLITEAAVMFGRAPSPDEIYSAEAFYSATESFGHDCRLLALWFLKLIAGSDKTGLGLAKDSSL
jgi:lipopolysaccharide/colanic/teichoic acid biosynthesis glycosyltransferase